MKKLLTLRNYVFETIVKHSFEKHELDIQVGILELYYKLVKIQIEIVAILWKKDVSSFMEELKR